MDRLIEKIGEDFHILRGEGEKDLDYILRLIYSLLGQMGYASLWDVEEDNAGKYVSITHYKRRMYNVLQCYLDMYPQLEAKLKDEEIYPQIKMGVKDIGEAVIEEIFDVHVSTGMVYHGERRLAPARPKEENFEGIAFIRGKIWEKDWWVSGLGAYRKMTATHHPEGVKKMFQLERGRFFTPWQESLKNARWDRRCPDLSLEYLRMEKTSGENWGGIWQNVPVRRQISLSRTKMKGNHDYFLYSWEDEMRLSPLPAWQTIEGAYRSLANGCLYAQGNLPKTQYKIRGNIVEWRVKYLYPPAESDFLRLYSWPLRYTNLPSPFTRIVSKEVFFPLKGIFESIGYEFEEAD